ncbi:MAG: hypothetical protein RL322_1076 [Pseudomonadota bacterium]|jgi:peptidoglycan/xylan/chitin deacetylase (PgdA/CDA1 family)
MDHDLYAFRARTRPAQGRHPPARLTAFVVLVLEHWDADPPAGHRRDPRFVGEYGSFDPDFRNWTQREYGLRIGVFRILDALTQVGLRPAVAINARLVERLPDLIDRLEALGVEWIAHGLAANQMMHAAMPLSEQRAHIEEATHILARRMGRSPAGWLSQDWGTSPETWELLAQAGYQYTLDWCNDDAPFPLQTSRPLMAVPLSPEWDDVQCQWLRNLEPRAHAALTERALVRLLDECRNGHGPACFGLALHPWVSGMSSRIGALRSLLSRIAALSDVNWQMPGEIVADWPARGASDPAGALLSGPASGVKA